MRSTTRSQRNSLIAASGVRYVLDRTQSLEPKTAHNKKAMNVNEKAAASENPLKCMDLLNPLKRMDSEEEANF